MQRFLSYENTILAVVMMVSFINPFTSSALTTALPSIGTAYGATDAQLSWVIELFLISSTVTIMPISKIADRIGKRHIFLFGVSLFCVSSLAVYFVNSLYGLFLLRILQGLGSASIFATSMAIVSLVTPPQRRGRAMGFTIAAVYCGLSFGPVLGGFFSYYLGWKTIFYFIAFICALAWLIAARSMTKEEWIDRQRERQSRFAWQSVVCPGHDCHYGWLIGSNDSGIRQIPLSCRSPLVPSFLIR